MFVHIYVHHLELRLTMHPVIVSSVNLTSIKKDPQDKTPSSQKQNLVPYM